MRAVLRVAMALLLLMAASIVAPRPVARVLGSEALAQVVLPTPDLPELAPSETPTPPTESPTPTPSESPSTSPSPSETSTPPGEGGGDGGGGDDGGEDEGGGDKGDGRKGGRHPPTFEGTYTPVGSFSTDRLVAVAAQLHALGVPRSKINKQVYAPFIIGGKAAWTNTWGAPRYGPATGQVRTHEGQDVFCSYGDPVLASEPGVVDYGDAGLGGKVARLFRSDGSYWYYAHLSDFNDERFPAGSRVSTGDVIGYCGNTGNALFTPPHVHFGWYQPNGKAKDPMGYLVRWLRKAQRNAIAAVAEAEGKRVELKDVFTLARRFGDSFMPDLSSLDDSAEALLSSETGTFGVAQSALMAALSQNFFELGYDPAAAALTSDAPAPGLSPGQQLDQILQETGFDETTGESGD